MPAHATRFILLDLDGTLTDPFPGISRCVQYALEQLGTPLPPRENLRKWIGPPLLESFRIYFEQLNLAHSEHLALDLYRERFSSIGLFENAVYPGVPRLLESLQSQDLKLILATAKPVVFARRILNHFGLHTFFHACHGSELDGRRTDKVELLQYILDQESVDAGRSVMIGDRHHDMAAGRYHGMQTIGVTWGYGSGQELLDAGAGQLAASPGELNRLLARSLS
ncbi:MAG: HAD hydrolase-like protein [Xanthomonadales bacterium]|nr:HAD hydrolase-like protein [Xanthomonadales bacterium]